jgi:hypothetical protein
MYPCTTGAAQDAWRSRSGTSLAPCWVATDGGLAACLVSRGRHDRHRDAAGRGCVAALMTASGGAIVEAVLVQLSLAAISLYIAARAQWSLARGLTTARAGL